MFAAMENWSGKAEYFNTKNVVFSVNGETAGYLKSVKNLRLLAMRNAGHMVPRFQPEYSFEMFGQFLDGTL
jgi:vitellogenic carboxypeptidase-like protein